MYLNEGMAVGTEERFGVEGPLTSTPLQKSDVLA